jgi:hypothetical protein
VAEHAARRSAILLLDFGQAVFHGPFWQLPA